MSFFEENPKRILDEIISDIIVDYVVSKHSDKCYDNNPIFQLRSTRCKELACKFSGTRNNISLDLGTIFFPNVIPEWEFLALRYARVNAHPCESEETTQGAKSAGSFVSGLSTLRHRKHAGDIEALRALDAIEREAKVQKTTQRPLLLPKLCKPEVKHESSIVNGKKSADVMQLSKHIGGEVSPDVLSLVLSMRMSPEDRKEESEIAGLGRVRKLIREKIIYPIKRPDLHFGLHQPPRGILLFGPPGTGKTMLAKWVATESGANFFEVTPSCLISKFYGETETIIRALFLVAEYYSPSVIFIDEVDSLLGKRREREDDSTIRMKNQLLQMMDGIRNNQAAMVVVVAATNRPDMLDEAALRRLSKRVLVDLPDSEAREGQIKNLLIKHHRQMLPQTSSTLTLTSTSSSTVPTSSGLSAPQDAGDSSKLIYENNVGLSPTELHSITELTEGWNGSDLKSLCAKAADYSYEEAIRQYGTIEDIPDITAFRPIQYSDFIRALKEVHPSISLNQDTNILKKWEEKFGCF